MPKEAPSASYAQRSPLSILFSNTFAYLFPLTKTSKLNNLTPTHVKETEM
jgi:hypothetical protein